VSSFLKITAKMLLFCPCICALVPSWVDAHTQALLPLDNFAGLIGCCIYGRCTFPLCDALSAHKCGCCAPCADDSRRLPLCQLHALSSTVALAAFFMALWLYDECSAPRASVATRHQEPATYAIYCTRIHVQNLLLTLEQGACSQAQQMVNKPFLVAAHFLPYLCLLHLLPTLASTLAWPCARFFQSVIPCSCSFA
jgi:hypothetical protein